MGDRTARGSNEPHAADPDAGEHRGVPLRVDATSCKGMPWPLNRDEITIRHKDESTKAVIDAVVEAKFQDHADPVRTEGGAP